MTIGFVRRMASHSMVCRYLARGARWVDRMDDRLEAGVRGEWSDRRADAIAGQLHALAAESRVVGVLRSLLNAPSAALPESAAARLLNPPLRMRDRIRTAGLAIVVAVLTHIAITAVFRTTVHSAGWSIRGVLVAAGVMAIGRPESLASAWEHRKSRRH